MWPLYRSMFPTVRRCMDIINHLNTSTTNGSTRFFHSLNRLSFITPTNLTCLTNPSQLLQSIGPQVIPSCGFKVKGRLKRRCKDCYFVVRQERSYVICKTHPRHKQMAMKKKDDKSWILTHATQSKVRPW